MTKLRYPFGGGAAVRQPCAVCTGASYECSTKSLERLHVLGGRCAYNYEQDTPAAALAWDKLGAKYRLYAEGCGRIAPGGQYRRRVGSCADGGADAKSRTQCWRSTGWRISRCMVRRMDGSESSRQRGRRWAILSCFGIDFWQQQTYAHRQQVHSLLYVAAHRLTPKGVAA